MKTIRALIVDDEAPARERLRRMLADVQVVEVVGEAETGEQALELYAELKPELVFLDVQMPGLNGLEVAQTLKDTSAIIFVTAYDEYALQAFEVNALDYLLKPFSRKRLEEAVSRAAGRSWCTWGTAATRSATPSPSWKSFSIPSCSSGLTVRPL